MHGEGLRCGRCCKVACNGIVKHIFCPYLFFRARKGGSDRHGSGASTASGGSDSVQRDGGGGSPGSAGSSMISWREAGKSIRQG